MSLRADKGDAQLRKPGRSGSSAHHHRGYSGGGGGGKGGGGGGPAPPPPISSSAAPAASSLSTNRSFKKSGNGQGAQGRVSHANPGSEPSASVAANRTVQNGTHPPVPLHDAPASSGAKPVDTKSSRALPKPPSSQPAAGAQDIAAPQTPTKGDASRSFTLQFGTINPGVMNGMQIPARTSSAPPNLDEQKQARHDSFRAVPTLPIPAAQKQQQQQQTRKDVGVNPSNTWESHPPTQTKRDVHPPAPSAPAIAPPKSSVHPMAGMPMPMPMTFQQNQVPLQFGAPGPQMQSQGVVASSLQMSMALPVGNAPQVPQQMFIPSIHSHPLQTQAMLHQGQGLGFAPQMSHQLTPQIGNMGIGIGSQFSQQQLGKFSGPRKTAVKITHPDTHEELRLDKRTDSYIDGSTPGQRMLPNVTPQSQPIPTFPPSHQMSFYSQLQQNTYSAPPMFFPTSLPLASTQMTTGSQAPRYSYPVSQGGQAISFMNQSVLNPMPTSKPGPPLPLHGVSEAMSSEGLLISTPPAPVQVIVKPPVGSYPVQVGTPSVLINTPVSKAEPSVTISAPISKAEPSVTISAPISKAEPSVTISAPISKAEPSVKISAPISKAEPTVIISKPVSKAESSVTSSMPISKAEMPKLLTTVASERDTESSTFQQSKSVSEPLDKFFLPALDRHSSMSTQRTQPETSPSAPVTPIGESASVLVGSDGGKKESVRRSESLKEHLKKTSKKDARHSQEQHQHQITASDPAENTKVSSSKIVKETSAADAITHYVSGSTENIQAPSEVDLSTSIASLPPSSVEHCVSLEAGASESIEGKAIRMSLGSSGAMLGREASQDVLYDLATDGASIKQRGASEASTLGPEVDGTISTSSDSSFTPADHLPAEVEQNQETLAAVEHGKAEVSNDSSLDSSDVKVYPVSSTAESFSVKEEETGIANSKKSIACELNDSEKQHNDTSNEVVCFNLEVDRAAEESDGCAITSLDFINAESVSSSHLTSANADEDRALPLDAVANKPGVTSVQDFGSMGPSISSLETANLTDSISTEMAQKLEGRVTELSNGNTVSIVHSGPKEKPYIEPTRTKIACGKKKKRKEILSKADAAGASDLYNAYKGPEQKHEIASTSGNTDTSLTVDANQVPIDFPDKDAVAGEEDGQNIAELDDWEEAADISTPKSKTSENAQLVYGAKKHDDYRNEGADKKAYSRDFLLTLAEQCTELPLDFEIGHDIAAGLLSAPLGTSREPHPSPGRITDKPNTGLRGDRRMGSMMDHGPAVMNFRPGQGVNHGVLKNPRGQPSNQFAGGILSGPMQSPGSQGGIPRNSVDADKWQRASGFQRGLMPSPQTPLQVMHKAEKKYEVGKVSDEEQAKQRQLKGILNKLTPQNFEKLFAQVKEVNIDNAGTLTGVISQIFDKALMEPTFCEMYANFCFHLASALPDFSEDNEKITFRRLLLNKCQEEFERGEREQAEANKVEEEGEIKQSEEQREEKRLRARRRMLGNIRLIGELYKKKMLTERIMHECIKKLLGQQQNPDEEDIEALCKLMSTIGEMIDHAKAKEHMDAYFDMMRNLSANQKISSRLRFMLRDSIDLRKNKWQQRRKVEGPKKIEELHRDAAQERQAQSSRLARGPVISSSSRRGPPIDHGPRGSTVSTPSSQQIGSIRSFPPHARGHTQDVRLEDRHQFEGRTLSVPLPQRHIDDNSITLGPQGGLAKGMSVRGQPLISNAPAEIHPSIVDPRRIASGPNGYSSISDRVPYTSREENMPRSMSDRFSGDRVVDRFSSGRIHGPLGGTQNTPETKSLSEEDLREKSISAIREFYSAKDEEEVALCVKDLKSPSFYPSMVSLWVTDSFERKDMERDLLATLLVNLCKSGESLLNHNQLVQGFESVLSSLEDAVNDAPKAAEFLGRIFAKVILENVVSLSEIGKLIRKGGEEPGRLLEIGLASEVLGSILEFIRTEKGDSALNEIRMSSNLRLDEFRAPHTIRSKKLDAFL